MKDTEKKNKLNEGSEKDQKATFSVSSDQSYSFSYIIKKNEDEATKGENTSNYGKSEAEQIKAKAEQMYMELQNLKLENLKLELELEKLELERSKLEVERAKLEVASRQAREEKSSIERVRHIAYLMKEYDLERSIYDSHSKKYYDKHRFQLNKEINAGVKMYRSFENISKETGTTLLKIYLADILSSFFKIELEKDFEKVLKITNQKFE